MIVEVELLVTLSVSEFPVSGSSSISLITTFSFKTASCASAIVSSTEVVVVVTL